MPRYSAVFVARDGTLTDWVGHPNRPERLLPRPRSAEAVALPLGLLPGG